MATNHRSVAGGRARHRECGVEHGACKQEFQEAADINVIMRKYRQTGLMPVMMGEAAIALSGEDLGYKTFADAYAALQDAEEMFLKLPPEIRLELGNDPGRYRELSSEEGIRRVLGRMGERARAEHAWALNRVRAAQPAPSPASPSGSPASPASAPPPGAPAGDKTPKP